MVIVVVMAHRGFMMPWLPRLTAMLGHDMPSGQKPTEQKHDCNGSMKKLHGSNVSFG